jgi:hypothetical protein
VLLLGRGRWKQTWCRGAEGTDAADLSAKFVLRRMSYRVAPKVGVDTSVLECTHVMPCRRLCNKPCMPRDQTSRVCSCCATAKLILWERV